MINNVPPDYTIISSRYNNLGILAMVTKITKMVKNWPTICNSNLSGLIRLGKIWRLTGKK
jgi:hypothetical protein